MKTLRRVGLYGGTFDPIHRGHTETALAEMRDMQWDEVVFIPARQQPFKQGQSSASPFHRFAMAVLATEHEPSLKVSDFELRRDTISYTIDTLREFHRSNPDTAFDWIVGEDNLALLPEWKNARELFELANFVVLRRGEEVSVPPQLSGRVRDAAGRGNSGSLVIARNRRVDVSATEIRRRIAAGEEFAPLVDPAVASYINRYRLYHSEV